MSSSVARRAGSKLLSLLSRATDPTSVNNRVEIYGKAVSGQAELHLVQPNGFVNQMTGPGSIVRRNYVIGLALSWTSVAQVTVGAGRCRAEGDSADIVLAAPIVCDITVAGVNGLDAGAEAASTWYYIYVISDANGVNPPATIMSVSAAAPTFPAGYNKARRIGCVRNSAGSNFLRFFQKWNGRTRRYYYDEDRATIIVLTAGNAIAFTTVTCTSRMPSTSNNAIFGIDFLQPTVGGANANTLTIHPTGSIEPTGPAQFRVGVTATAGMYNQAELPTSAGQQVDYLVSDADDVVNLYIIGFDDEI